MNANEKNIVVAVAVSAAAGLAVTAIVKNASKIRKAAAEAKYFKGVALDFQKELARTLVK